MYVHAVQAANKHNDSNAANDNTSSSYASTHSDSNSSSSDY